MQRSLAILLLIALFVLPGFSFAQSEVTQENAPTPFDALRAQIRADLLQDPRASELSPADFEALVVGLATQAQEEGVASDYLGTAESFDYSAQFPSPEVGSASSAVLAPSMLIALSFLILIVLSLILYIVRKRGSAFEGQRDLEA